MTQDELEMVNQYINIIGVNNRNLKTFEVNTEISEKISSENSGRISEDLRKRDLFTAGN